jgi:preprotein translocase subunit YajC
LQFLIVIVVMFALMYLLVMRPQRQRQLAQQRMLDRIAAGTGILTAGGIYGTVEEIDDDGDLWVEIAEGVSVHVARRSVGAVIDYVEEEDEHEPEAEAAEQEPEAAEQEPEAAGERSAA